VTQAKRTANDYIFAHSESKNLFVRLRDEKGRRFVRSLRTTDRAVAEVVAGPMVTEHKARLLAARAPEGVMWRHEYEPGREHLGPDGGRIVATERELIYLDAEGRIRIKGPNGGLGGLRFAVPAPGTDRPSPAVKDSDDALLETYVAHAGLNAVRTKEARDAWHLFKVTVGKPLAKCTRDDGRAVVAAMGDVKSATARRKLVPLVALVNLAIGEGKHAGINPFVGVVADRDDSERRAPFNDDDMKLIGANLGKLDKRDQLLIRLLACTGVRRGEAFAIDREQSEKGVRFVIVGSKTDQSLRRVPLPADLLPHLKKITGPLFAGRLDGATKRLGRFLRDIGITDPNKAPMHSFRHRAQDRLRAAGCPQDIRWAILGHEEKSIAAGYGEGFPVTLLRKWADKIGGP
jgi:integrase